MTLDHLVQKYQAGKGNTRDVRAGIAALVRALRDKSSAHPGACWACHDNTKMFDRILGEAEAAAGATALEAVGDGLSPASGQAPAATKLPAERFARLKGMFEDDIELSPDHGLELLEHIAVLEGESERLRAALERVKDLTEQNTGGTAEVINQICRQALEAKP